MSIGKISIIALLAAMMSVPAHAQGAYGTSAKVQKNRQALTKQTYSGMQYPYAQPAAAPFREVAPGSATIYTPAQLGAKEPDLGPFGVPLEKEQKPTNPKAEKKSPEYYIIENKTESKKDESEELYGTSNLPAYQVK